MGSRPSSTYTGTNGTVTNQAEVLLRTENNQLKEKIKAFEKLEPDKLKQENEELKRLNKDLYSELEILRESISRKSNDNLSEQAKKSQHGSKDTKEKQRSTRRINSNLTPQRMSDIDAYGQGIPLEKHPPIKIKSRRKREKRGSATEGDDSKPKSSIETKEDQSQGTSKINAQGHLEQPESLTPDKDPDGTTCNVNAEQQMTIDSGQSLENATPCLSADEDNRSCQESDLL
ncbi:uncharacterized protein LOC110973241 [Acanthaster planci]|uniref:Uncharacterized protein LOC110973241 n=1 Tax=Acanthaster planci TaxID=133434 RepID=A0A8B7XI54_ACAPL|nr:uncharacterized protein LOC110973241 [Acanthaster planci]